MARSHRFMQAATLNSLVRALAPSSAARALRMVSFMTTLRLPTYHATSIALIGACARQHLSAEASDLYWWAAACRPCALLFYTHALRFRQSYYSEAHGKCMCSTCSIKNGSNFEGEFRLPDSVHVHAGGCERKACL